MTLDAGRLRVTDFPDELHDEVAERLSLYTVGFSSLRIRDGVEHSEQSGSGTLIKFSGRYGILTADHVVEQIHDGSHVGFLTDFRGGMRRVVFERKYLQFVRLGSQPYGPDGPDLALVVLPLGEPLSVLVREKIFFDLDRRRAPAEFESYPETRQGFWFVCGIQAEGAKEIGAARAFRSVRGVWGMCAIAANPQELEHNGFDYLELGVPEVGPNVPTQLNGISGSGLWQVLVRKSVDGALYAKPEDFLLSGVAFYEWFPPNRRLRCHGRRSVFEKLMGAVV